MFYTSLRNSSILCVSCGYINSSCRSIPLYALLGTGFDVYKQVPAGGILLLYKYVPLKRFSILILLCNHNQFSKGLLRPKVLFALAGYVTY
jgi:hypothetical protein